MALVNRVRGLSPSPGAYLILLDGQRIRLLKAEAASEAGPPGVILRMDQTVVVGTGTGAVVLREVQPEGKRRMTGAEFARGRHLRAGVRCV